MGFFVPRHCALLTVFGVLGACSEDDAPSAIGPGTGGSGGSGAGAQGGASGNGGDASAGSAGSAGASGSAGTVGTAGASGGGAGGSAGSATEGGPGGTNGAAGTLGTAGSGGNGGSGGTGTLDGSAGNDGAAGSSACGPLPAPPPSCGGLSASCGSQSNEGCCSLRCVPGGSYVMGRALGAPDDACHPEDPPFFSCDADEAPVSASVRAFWLDRFEITVGRFRKFVAAAAAGYRPPADSGKHGYLNRGSEPGWNASWPLPTTAAAWSTALNRGTWTAAPGANENKPITSINWYAAQAFCIYDGGFLPTEAEWELAASGGEERIFPWSTPPNSRVFDATHSALACCTTPSAVGLKPPGDGRWGHADLAGNVFEWTLDVYESPFPIDPCDDCVADSPRILRTVRGGDYDNGAHPRAAARELGQVDARDPYVGARCARRAAVGDGG